MSQNKPIVSCANLRCPIKDICGRYTYQQKGEEHRYHVYQFKQTPMGGVLCSHYIQKSQHEANRDVHRS